MGMGSISNTKGKVFYGIHFYPGVAEYQDPQEGPYRVFLNEDTLRSMDPTFAGKPVFVDHVQEVEASIDELRKEADGWVIKSFYNAFDGKHWVEFIVVSEAGQRAIESGMRLSNAYIPKTLSDGGLWNGVSYKKEITQGEYEHLAIVANPRYEESVIMTPEQFKKYNSEKEIELKRIANSKDEKGETKMKLNFFKREKIENALDIETTRVELPKSKKEVTIAEAIETADKFINMAGYADPKHMVKVGENEMAVEELVKKHMDACNELESMKMKKEDAVSEEGGEPGKGADDDAVAKNEDSPLDDMGSVGDRGGDKSLDNEEEKEEEKKDEVKKNEIQQKVAALKNARPTVETVKVDLSTDKIARGKSRYGSN